MAEDAATQDFPADGAPALDAQALDDGADGGEADGDEAGSDDERGSVRRCVVTGTRQPPERMVRFVVAPNGEVVPDIEGNLPGRGIWLSASRDVVNTAVAKRCFAKAARARVTVAEDMADRVEALLTRRCLELLGLARRAGQALAGYDKVRGELLARRGALLLEAADGAAGGRGKVRALAPSLPLVEVFDSAELGPALGREAAVHVVVGRGRLAARLLREVSRLVGFRPGRIELAGPPVCVGGDREDLAEDREKKSND